MTSVMRGFKGSAGAKFGFVVKNESAVINKIASYGAKSQTKVIMAVKSALILTEAEAIRLVAGNVYWKNPIDTRRMINSITNKLEKFSYTMIEGKVGTNVEYAIYVHEGTVNMMKAANKACKDEFGTGKRPFLTDALANKRAEIIKMIIDAYKKEIYQ